MNTDPGLLAERGAGNPEGAWPQKADGDKEGQ